MVINHVESPCLSMFHDEILILHRLKPLTNQVWVPASLFGASADWAPLSPSWTSAACYMVSLGGPKALFDIMVIGCHWVCLKMRHPAITFFWSENDDRPLEFGFCLFSDKPIWFSNGICEGIVGGLVCTLLFFGVEAGLHCAHIPVHSSRSFAATYIIQIS